MTKGIIALATQFILEQKGNIVYIDQHVDREAGIFFMRFEGELEKDLIIWDSKLIFKINC